MSTITLYPSGILFNVLDPELWMFNIEDIAHALSKECRYANHIDSHLSVSEHSVGVCNRMTNGLKLPALLHDASEYVLKDLPKPIKMLLPDYQKLELRYQTLIYERFRCPLTSEQDYRTIKQADVAEYEAEQENNCMGKWTEVEAELRFLDTFERLIGERI